MTARAAAREEQRDEPHAQDHGKHPEAPTAARHAPAR
jgi:hypothetical protein